MPPSPENPRGGRALPAVQTAGLPGRPSTQATSLHMNANVPGTQLAEGWAEGGYSCYAGTWVHLYSHTPPGAPWEQHSAWARASPGRARVSS